MKDKLNTIKENLYKYKNIVLKITSAILVVSIIYSQIYFYNSGYERIADFYSYYTMLVTLLAGILILISIFKDINIKVYFVITIDVAIMLFIAPTIIPGFSVALFTLHFLVPIYLFIYLFLYYDTEELNNNLSIKDIKYILIFPAIYLVLVVTRGIIVNRFPYSFVEFSSQGIISIIIFFLILVAIFVVIYFILYNVITSKYKHHYSLLSLILVTGVLLSYIFVSDIVRTQYNHSNINYNQELFYIGEYDSKSLFKGYKEEGCYLINEQGNYEEFPYKDTCLEYNYHSNNYLYNINYGTNEIDVYNPIDNSYYNITFEMEANKEIEAISVSSGYLYIKYITEIVGGTYTVPLTHSVTESYRTINTVTEGEYTLDKYELATNDKIYSFSNDKDFKVTMYDMYYKITVYEYEYVEVLLDGVTITVQKESFLYYDINTLEEIDENDIVRDTNDILYIGSLIYRDEDYLYTYYIDRENTYIENGCEYMSFYILKYDLITENCTYIKIPYNNGFRYSMSYYYDNRLYGNFYIERIRVTDDNTIVIIEPSLDEVKYYEINFDLEIVTNIELKFDYNRLILDNKGNILAVSTYRDIYAYRYTESIKTRYINPKNYVNNVIFDYNYYI